MKHFYFQTGDPPPKFTLHASAVKVHYSEAEKVVLANKLGLDSDKYNAEVEKGKEVGYVRRST